MNQTSQNREVYEFGVFRLDANERVLMRGAEVMSLTPKAFETLLVLVRNRGRIVTKQEIINAVWPDSFVEEGSLTFNVSAIRKALGETNGGSDGANATVNGQKYIETVPKRGYRFAGAFHEPNGCVSEAAPPPVEHADESSLAAQPDVAVERTEIESASKSETRGPQNYRWGWPAVLMLLPLFLLGITLKWLPGRSDSSAAASTVASTVGSSVEGAAARASAERFYKQGRFFWNKRSTEGSRHAEALFKQAMEADPTFAPAYAGLADTYAFEPYNSPLWREGERLAHQALQLNPSLAEPHASLGFIQTFHYWNWTEAEREFRQAIELNPNYPTAHHWYAILLEALGRVPEAKREIRRAWELDPLSLPITTDVSEIYLRAREPDQAIEWSRKALELEPDFAPAKFVYASARAQKGHFDLPEATYRLNACTSISPSNSLNLEGWDAKAAYQQAGCREIVRKAAASSESANNAQRLAYGLAKDYASLGDKERALFWLERARQEHNFFMIFIKVDSSFDLLHDDERFKTILRQMNLAADH